MFDNGKQARYTAAMTHDKQVGIRLPSDMVQFLEEEASKRRVSMSVIIRELILAAMLHKARK